MGDLTKTKEKLSDLAVKKSTSSSGIAAFAERSRALKAAEVRKQGRGRLIFAMDATGSRQPTWDTAVEIQAKMLSQVTGLDLQLFFFRGGKHAHSAWVSSPERLADITRGVVCKVGSTNIASVLEHAREEVGKSKVDALVFIGDAFEEELDQLAPIARELGRLGLPAFMFQETNTRDKDEDAKTEFAFQQIAELTHGAYCRFDAGAARQLAELLRTVAAYATGNTKTLVAKPNVAGWLSYFSS